jgi:hypothetical protein
VTTIEPAGPRSKVGDVVQPGQPIPANVTEARDRHGDRWIQLLDRTWRCVEVRGEPWDGTPVSWQVISGAHGPLTVTAVREQPAEPEPQQADEFTALNNHVNQFGDMAARMQLMALIEQRDEARAALVPQQADASPVLDLVRQYGGALSRSYGLPSAASMGLLARIAALVPQQPVQARYRQGEAWWIHECGMAVPFRVAPDNSEHHCFPPCKTPGPWLPLLVGGDPAPEPPESRAAYWERRFNEEARSHDEDALSILTLHRERDEARAEVERLAVELAVEREAEERGNAELKDIVRRLDEAEVDSGGASERVGYAIQSMQRGWATATNNLALLDTVKSDRETIRGSLNYLKDTVTGPAIKLLGVQHNEDIVPAIERLKATQPDPRKLSLPKVPEGTEALTGIESGRRYARGTDSSGETVWAAGIIGGTLGEVLDGEPDGVRVELAPPREPRTWPKLDEEHADLPGTVSVERHGTWRRLAFPDDCLYEQADGFGAIKVGLRLPLSGLQLLGEVTEVTE